jgi:hypothetical protein
MKTFKEFISEVRRPENGSEEEKRRYDAVKSRHDAMSDEDRQARMIGIVGRDGNGIQRYGFKKIESRNNQQKNRESRLADIDSDLDPNYKKNNKGNKKIKLIQTKGTYKDEDGKEYTGRGKESHHLTKIADSAREFAGLSPEERKAKREKDAEAGKFHGSDRRNIAQTDGPEGGTGIPHRGKGGYHSGQKPVGKGGSIQDFGSEKEIVAVQKGIERRGYSALEKLRREKRQAETRARMDAAGKEKGFD